MRLSRQNLFFTTLILFSLCIGSLNSCKWDLSDPISWNVNILAPIATSSVTLADAISDSTLITQGANNQVILIYRDTLASISLDSLLKIPDTTYTQRFDLETFELNNQSFFQNVNLAFIARALSQQGNIVGDIILLNHGGILPTLPETRGLSSGSIPVDASNLFEFADLTQGSINMVIRNNLPVDIQNVSFELRNQQRGDVIVSDFFTNLLQGAEEIRTYNLAGKFVESSLEAELTNLDVPAASAVPIDTNDFIGIDFTADGLIAEEATAIFPSQTIDSALFPFTYDFTGEFDDVKIMRARIKSGNVDAEVISTFEDSIRFIYRLPSAQRNGQIPEVNGTLEPATSNEPFLFLETRELDGYELDFTGLGTSFNTLLQYYKIDLVYSGNLVTIDQQDSVVLFIRLNSVSPDYVEGFFGSDTLSFRSSQLINSLGDLSIDQLNLKAPKARLIFENSLGLPISTSIKQLRVRNTQKPDFVPLSSTLFATPLTIGNPTLADTSETVTTVYTFDTGNSNIRELLNELPNLIDYDLEVMYNTNIPFESLNNFATSHSKLLGIVEFEIPLEGSVRGLTLQDTTGINFSTNEDTALIEQGTLKIQFDNQFPFEVIATAGIFDENFLLIDVIADEDLITAGRIDEDGRVREPASSEIEKKFSKPQLNKVLQRGKYLIFNYRINSKPEGESVKIYSDYQVQARLVGDISYQAQP